MIMARLRNKTTGAVVEVADEKAARLGAEWENASAPTPVKRSTRRTTKKSASADKK